MCFIQRSHQDNIKSAAALSTEFTRDRVQIIQDFGSWGSLDAQLEQSWHSKTKKVADSVFDVELVLLPCHLTIAVDLDFLQ